MSSSIATHRSLRRRALTASRAETSTIVEQPDGAAFRAAIEEAGRGVDVILEATAIERAVNGQEEIVYYQGQRVGVRWKYDNRLLMSLLRARNPLKYAPLSEIEGWLARRGIAPPADVERALDRLAAAEAEWGRRLPGEPDPTARPALAAGPPATQFAQASNLSISGPETPIQASTSSTLPVETPAAPEPGDAASAYRPPPRARIRLA